MQFFSSSSPLVMAAATLTAWAVVVVFWLFGLAGPEGLTRMGALADVAAGAFGLVEPGRVVVIAL